MFLNLPHCGVSYFATSRFVTSEWSGVGMGYINAIRPRRKRGLRHKLRVVRTKFIIFKIGATHDPNPINYYYVKSR